MPNYLQDIEILVNEKIDQGALDTAISIVVVFVEGIINDSRATARVFGSEILDNLCQKIGNKALEKQNFPLENKLEFEDELIIYIATELYITGGHTAVLEDFIKFQPKKKHLILLTDLFNRGESEAIKNRFSPLTARIEWAEIGTYIDKLHWLQEQLVIHKPSQIFLFNHHQDAVAIAAVQPGLVSQLIFYHHCDHNLCLGLYLTSAKHIDPHSFGYYNCRNNLGVKNTTYIPLIAEDLNSRSSDVIFLEHGKLRTCSSGSANKFEPSSYAYSYAKEVPKFLSITGGWHIHIGSLLPQTLDNIKSELQKAGIDSERFIYIPWVKSLWQAMLEQKIDMYISSFPIGGARGSVEVMGSGTPIIGHKNYHSQLLGVVDIIYPESFSWSDPQELYDYLSSLDQETLSKHSLFARTQYEKYHTVKIFLECIEDLRLENDSLSPVPLKEYFRDQLKGFLDDVMPSKLQLQQTQAELQQTQAELQQTQAELQQTQAELSKLRNSRSYLITKPLRMFAKFSRNNFK